MSAAIGLISTQLSSTLKGQGRSIGSLLIVVVTSVLNYILNKDFFKCPKEAHVSFGLCFMFIPAVVAFVMVFMLSFGTSEIPTGMCKRDKDSDKIISRKRGSFICRSILIALAQSIVGLLSWVIVTLLTTDAWCCISNGPMPTETPSNEDTIRQYLDNKDKATGRSKIVGMCLLLISFAIAMLIYFLVKCCYKDPPSKKLAGERSFDEFEALAAAEVFNSHQREAAEQIGILTAHRALQMDTSSLTCQNHQVETVDKRELEKRITKAREFLAKRYPRLEHIENKKISFRDKKMTLGKSTRQEMSNTPGHHDAISAATAVGNPGMAKLLDEVDGSDNGYSTTDETTDESNSFELHLNKCYFSP